MFAPCQKLLRGINLQTVCAIAQTFERSKKIRSLIQFNRTGLRADLCAIRCLTKHNLCRYGNHVSIFADACDIGCQFRRCLNN